MYASFVEEFSGLPPSLLRGPTTAPGAFHSNHDASLRLPGSPGTGVCGNSLTQRGLPASTLPPEASLGIDAGCQQDVGLGRLAADQIVA